MNGSILTNQGAMVALQTMKSINKSLGGVQDMISTGKRVATSKDNAAIWAISSVMESDVSSFKAVTDSLALGQSTVAVARNAAEQVKDSLIEIKSKIIAAQEENVDRDKIQADVEAIRSQIKSIVGASQFNGLNLLKSSENLEVLSSLDRSSNGSTTTSVINIDAKSLDSGTAAKSVAGATVVSPTNAAGPVITAAFTTGTGFAPVTDGEATLEVFDDTTGTIAFATTTSLDQGDTIKFKFSNTAAGGTDTFELTYTHTATGNSQTTGEELSKQLADAYAAFSARDSEGAEVNVGTGAVAGDYVASTKTYTAAEGSFAFSAVAGTGTAFTLSDTAGTLSLTNLRDLAVAVSVEDMVDYAQTDIVDDAADALTASGGTDTLTFGTTGNGLQKDDTYAATLLLNDAEDSSLRLTVAGAALTKAELADTLERAFEAFKSGGFSSTSTAYTGTDGEVAYGGAAGKLTINGATVTLAYSDDADGNSTGSTITEAAFKTGINTGATDIDFTNGASGTLTVTNNTTAAYTLAGDVTLDTAAATSVLTIGGTTINNAVNTTTSVGSVAAGTLGDFAQIDINNDAYQVGDTVAVTIEGLNLDAEGVAQPLTYTATNGQTADQIATGFAAVLNTAFADAGLTDVTAAQASGGLVNIKNFNTTATRKVSDLGVANESSNIAVATDSTGAKVSSIAAGATNKVTFTGREVAEGDTYNVKVGTTAVSYTARKGDDLNTIGKNIEGLLKINSKDNITVDFTTATDPTKSNSVLTIKNKGSSAITSFTATVKAGGKSGGGLELLDQIDVTDGAKAEGSLDLIESLIDVAIDAASSYGSSEKRLSGQQEFISKLTDSLKSGIGSLVDANLEETSARLQALQVQQQLGTQALSIANQSPQSILSLFR